MPAGRARAKGNYPETSWTLIEAAGQEGSADAYERFRRLYHGPVLAYMRNLLRTTALDAVEKTDDFFSDKVWDGNVLRSARRGNTPFRHFLKRCVRNYALDQIRAAGAQPGFRSIDDRRGSDPMEHHSFDFEVEWARGVLARAISDARVACEANDQHTHFEVFRRRFLVAKDASPEWAEVAAGLKDADGGDLTGRRARGYAETVVRHVRKALMVELEEQTGSSGAANDELLTLVSILETAM